MLDQNIVYNQINNINPIGEISIIILVTVTSIFLAFNEDSSKKEYQKKYILVCYFLIYILLMIFNLRLKYIFGIFSIILIPLSGINSAYNSDSVEKELGGFNLILYKSIEWIFFIKFHIFYVCLSSILLSNKLITLLFKSQYITIETITYTLIIVGFLFYHLSSNIIDKFGVISFEKLKENILSDARNFTTDNNDEIFTLLGFVIFTEDKDYFNRKKPYYSLLTVIKRKLKSNLNTSSQPPKKDSNLFSLLKRLLTLLKIIFSKRIIRGYSTLDGQYIRVNALYPDSYQYKIRRKIFVEWIYAPTFYKAWHKMLIRSNYSKDNDFLLNIIKVNILKSYFINSKILKNPSTLEELLANFNSSLNRTTYIFCWKQYLDSKESIIKDLRKRFNATKQIN